MRIQHNIMAMNAYRNYNTNTKALSGNLEKLSSGYKINRAGDDAAGLAISEKMRAQITGLDAAQKNVKDGISLVKTAEGAMQEIQDMLNRMDYLATQSANGTYDNEVDRKNLQKEVDALKTEIDRIADSANFNGIKLLDGSLAGQEAVAASSYTYTVKGSSAEGTERLISTVAADTDKTYEVAGQKTILDSVGAQPTTAKFHINLNELKVSNYGTAAGTIKSITITIGDLTMKATNVSVGAKGNVNTAAIASSIATKLKAFATAANGVASTVTLNGMKWSVKASGGVLTFEQKAVAPTDAKAAANFDVKVSAVTTGSGSSANVSLDGKSLNPSTHVDRAGVSINAGRQANTIFEVKKTDIQDKATFKIGDKTLTLKVGANSKVTATGSSVVVDLTDMEEGKIDNDKLYVALSRISAALGSKVTDSQAKDITGAAVAGVELSVGVSRQTNAGVVKLGIGVHRIDGGSKAVYTDTDKLGAIFSITTPSHTVTVTTPAIASDDGGLTLQIGDTSDKFNQMKVRIGDMHVKSMGAGKYTDGYGVVQSTAKTIKDIDISTQSGAQEAVQIIKNAINYVSGIRGDLGAAQNRLEHTGNNLSVMAENIQDAESTIRDTDVADEMMKYVKNNILVQSAQAMLAQANQVPQGVLQLLG